MYIHSGKTEEDAKKMIGFDSPETPIIFLLGSASSKSKLRTIDAMIIVLSIIARRWPTHCRQNIKVAEMMYR